MTSRLILCLGIETVSNGFVMALCLSRYKLDFPTFFFFLATLAACGSSQARDQTRATAVAMPDA